MSLLSTHGTHKRRRKSRSRSIKADRAWPRFRPQLERLETRTVLAAGPTALFFPATGELQIRGTRIDDHFDVSVATDGTLQVAYNGSDLAIVQRGRGGGSFASDPSIVDVSDIDVSLFKGDDRLTINIDPRMSSVALQAQGHDGTDTLELLGSDESESYIYSVGPLHPYPVTITVEERLTPLDRISLETIGVENQIMEAGDGDDDVTLTDPSIVVPRPRPITTKGPNFGQLSMPYNFTFSLGDGEDSTDVELGNCWEAGVCRELAVSGGEGNDALSIVATEVAPLGTFQLDGDEGDDDVLLDILFPVPIPGGGPGNAAQSGSSFQIDLGAGADLMRAELRGVESPNAVCDGLDRDAKLTAAGRAGPDVLAVVARGNCLAGMVAVEGNEGADLLAFEDLGFNPDLVFELDGGANTDLAVVNPVERLTPNVVPEVELAYGLRSDQTVVCFLPDGTVDISGTGGFLARLDEQLPPKAFLVETFDITLERGTGSWSALFDFTVLVGVAQDEHRIFSESLMPVEDAFSFIYDDLSTL